MSRVQYIEKNGRRTHAVLDIKEYERLLAAAEDAADVAAVRNARANPDDLVPGEIAERLIAGENPVKVWRGYRGMTQSELAEKSGFDQADISRIERGQREPTGRTLRALASALDVTVGDLVSSKQNAPTRDRDGS